MDFSNNFRTIVGEFFRFNMFIKMLHWQTKYYAVHKTTDGLLLALDPLFDQFMETLQGELSQKIILNKSLTFVVEDMSNLSQSDIINFVAKFKSFLATDLENIIQSTNIKNKSALLNIRDEMLGEIQKSQYLFTFQ